MRFDDWLREKSLTLQDAAALIGSDRSNTRRYAAHQQVPRPSTMRRIYLVTRCAVTPNDFYDLPELGECDPGHTDSPPDSREAA